MSELPELRVRSKISKAELDRKVGRVLTAGDYNVLLTGAARVLDATGKPLLVYLPQAIPEHIADAAYPILTTIRGMNDNRGKAAGAPTVKVGSQTRSRRVRSNVIGYFDAAPPRHAECRLTAWTGSHTEQFKELFPLFQQADRMFAAHMPHRHEVQKARWERTPRELRIPGTSFTTVTVNNTYPTGVHVDDGDLPEGFSCLAVLRRGNYTGGVLTLPEYRIGVDLHDRDVVLMDAHNWHGNTAIVGDGVEGEDYERISVVLYYRTEMVNCAVPRSDSELPAGADARQKNVGVSA